MTPVVRIAWLPGADTSLPLPDYATEGAAGADLRANLPGKASVTLAPGERALVPLGFAMELPEGWEMQVRPRSGLALRHGIALVNAPGTVDADYRGAVGVVLINHGRDAFEIAHGERIAQGVIAPVTRARFELADALGETARGTGGFGSTGRG